MFFYIIKIIITTILIVVISEVSKRSSFIGALLASLPLISLLAIFWIYFETKDIEKIANFSTSVFWLVLPSLVLFILLPILLRLGLHFYISISLSIMVTIITYWLMSILKFNIS